MTKKSREYEDKKEFKRRAADKHNDGVVLYIEDEVHGSGAFELILKKALSNITVGELQAAVRDQFRWICSPFELRLTLQPSNRRYRKGTRHRNRRSSATNARGVGNLYAGADHSSSPTATEDSTSNAGSSLNEALEPVVDDGSNSERNILRAENGKYHHLSSCGPHGVLAISPHAGLRGEVLEP